MTILADLLALVIVVALPIRGWITNRHLESRMRADAGEPMKTFRRSAVVKWSLTAVAVVVLVADDRLGLYLFGSPLALLFPLAFAIVLLAFHLRLRNRDLGLDGARQLGHTIDLLPVTADERRRWVYLCITAGVTEEVLYRAFLLTYLYATVPWFDLRLAAVASGIAFGTVHAYQGWRGMVVTSIIGIGFGLLYPWTGLVVLIVLHTMFDLRVLLVPPDVIRRARTPRT